MGGRLSEFGNPTYLALTGNPRPETELPLDEQIGSVQEISPLPPPRYRYQTVEGVEIPPVPSK